MKPVLNIRFIFAVTIILTATGNLFSQNHGPERDANASAGQRRINTARYEKETSSRNTVLDSLVRLYDRQLASFGNSPAARAGILKQKARDYLMLIPLDREGIRNSFADALDADRENPDPEFIVLYFNELTIDYISREIGAALYIDNYSQLSSLIDKATLVTVTDARNAATDARGKLDNLFVSSGANDCGIMERAYKELLADKPDDLVTLTNGFALLTRFGCKGSCYLQLGDAILRLRPAVVTAMTLAEDYSNMGNYRKAAEYYRTAVSIEKDQAAKAALCVNISSALLTSGDLQGAADFARMATVYNPRNGNAYIAQAKAYAEGAAGCGDFDRQAVNWLAYDLVMNAMRLVSGNAAEMKKLNDLLNTYRNGFPSKEELFFRWLNEGETYEIKCGWITGTTTVREGN